jgi:hypothetical protein
MLVLQPERVSEFVQHDTAELHLVWRIGGGANRLVLTPEMQLVRRAVCSSSSAGSTRSVGA